MALKGAVVAILLLIIAPVLAGHRMRVISVDEFIQRRLTQPEDEISLARLDSKSREHLQYWLNRLADESLQVVGPCRLPEDAAHVCDAPPYPLFPFSESYRNALLQRPAPDVVRANIEQATNGEVSTVEDLVERVNANLEDLGMFSDDELTLLATSFAEPKAGLTIQVACSPISYGGWPEDLLISQDEQRALLAGFLYVLGDNGYLARRDEELKQHAQRTEPNPKTLQQCQADVSVGAGRFRASVERLDAEVIISEAEWLARYDEYLAILRADLYRMVPGGARGWAHVEHKIDDIVSAAEDLVDERIDCNVPRGDPGFSQYLDETKDGIQGSLPELRPGIARRVAYRRWKQLPSEDQAANIAET